MADILVVDDTPENLKVLHNILSSNGYSVRIAKDGKMAVTSVEKSVPDLILMDINMPVMDGIEACKIIKENKNSMDVPVIFVSANTDSEHIVRGLSVGGVDYITKPFVRSEILARVNVHLNLYLAKKKFANAEVLSAIVQMVIGIAHEVNTPLGISLTSVSSLSDSIVDLERDHETGSLKKSDLVAYIRRFKEFTDIVNRSIRTSIQRLSAFKMVTMDHLDSKVRTINIDAYVSEAMSLLKHELDANKISLELNCSDEDIETAPGYLFHIISNLVQNTIDHAYDDDYSGTKKIHLDVGFKAGRLRIVYWDNGCGVPDSNLDKVLSPFFTTKRGDNKHIGLSASIINNIVCVALDGQVVVESGDRGLHYTIQYPVEKSVVNN